MIENLLWTRGYMGKITRKLEIDFLSENPNGIRVVHGVSFPFRAYIVPLSCMSDATSIIEGEKIGVYFLFDEKRTQVYIGQTANGIGRLQTHRQQKDFWSIAIMFLKAKDEWISFIDELETYCIIQLEKTSRYQLLNKNKLGRKEDSLTRLSEIRDEIFPYIKFCLATFEYNIDSNQIEKKEENTSGIPVVATRGGIKAKGLYNPDDNSIIVKAGSEIRYDVKAFGENINKQRQEFKETGKIKKVKGKYILQEDVSFDKLSPAAEFVIGGSCNGKIEWKYIGKTLKESFNL